jgi:hypothetical protein
MISQYTIPNFKNHNVLYKGKRYWVLEIDKNHPYEGYEEDCNCVVVDRKYGGVVISWCNKQKDGTFKGYVQYGQGSDPVEGKTPKELVDSVVRFYKWVEKTER